MAKKRQDDLLSMLSEALQERIPSMNKSNRKKTIEVLETMMPGLFDMLPEEDRGTKVPKTKVVKMTPVNKVEAKVRLKNTAKSRMSGKAYLDDVEPRKMQLKITLNRIKPTVWRKIEVPSNISLEHLHTVIQMAFGWSNEHLHKFMVGDEDIEPKGRGYANDADYDAWKVSLEEVLPAVGCSIKYLYDFGASWVHSIKLESIGHYADDENRIERLTERKGTCPAED